MLNIGYKNHPKHLGIFVLKLYSYNETFEEIFKQRCSLGTNLAPKRVPKYRRSVASPANKSRGSEGLGNG